MRTIFGLLLAIVLGWIFWRVWVVAEKSGMLRTLHYPQGVECRPVTGTVGAEDAQIDPATGLVYVAAFDRYRYLSGDKTVRGEVGVFSLMGGDSAVRDLTAASGAPERSAPHGLSLHVGADGKKTLAVINHANGEAVEIFDVIASPSEGAVPGLVHRRTVTDALFRSLNDVVLVGHDAFYAANDHHFPPGFMQAVENYLLLDKTDVVYFDGTTARVAAGGLTYANGINVSPDGKRIYVAETTDNVLRTYDRNLETGDLTLVPAKWGKTDLGFGIDNIDVAPDGSLYIAGHPKLLTLQKHFAHPDVPSPTQVVRLVPTAAGWDARTVFLDDGKKISGGSVAVRGANGLILGSILGKDILVCPYKE